jgi:hypothetical protein
LEEEKRIGGDFPENPVQGDVDGIKHLQRERSRRKVYL